ncbi:MAG: SDR family NAD(P)-dependent oxidoreductase [Rubellimicrobium sp.]|nr:SDR family NAD(P)-dependent oxidoreductase [Rubellimicrobium sp.]
MTSGLECLVLAPAGLPAARLAVAAARAGAVPVLPVTPEGIDSALTGAAGAGRFGLSLSDPALLALLAARDDLPPALALVIAPPPGLAEAPGALSAQPAPGRRRLCEARRCSQDVLALAPHIDGYVLKGHECGGVVSEQTGFVLLQEFRRKTGLPLFVQGGITPETAAAAHVGGASGVVLDDQILLLAESPLTDARLRRRIEGFSGSETLQVEEMSLGLYLRGLDAPGGKRAAEFAVRLRENPAAIHDIAAGFSWQPGAVAPAGQGLALAAGLARRYRTLGRLVGAIARAVGTLPGQAASRALLAEGAPLAQSLGTRYPILQGPMTRVSDVSDFFLRVAEGGALPFAALALLSGPQTQTLLEQTRDLLGGRPWGVGMLGFADTRVLGPQMEAVDKVRPDFAIIAGGRINQVMEFEGKGIPAFVHASTAGIIAHYLDEGVRRFILEGRECGGHVGPMSSFTLWGAVVEALKTHPVILRDGKRVQIVLAGGIHDAASAAMAATVVEPLAAQAVQIGVLMGTGYLFTREIVESGAIVPDYQQVALDCAETRCLWEGPGFASRCAITPIVEEFVEARARLEADGAGAREIRETLEHFSLGRLRMATKGLARTGPEKELTEIGPEERHQKGMYMIGQVAALRHEVRSIAEFHADVSAGSVAHLQALERAEPLTAAAPPPADIAIVGMATLLPGADTLSTYWRRILTGESAIREIPEDRWDIAGHFDADRTVRDKVYSRWGGFLEDVAFNPLDYGIPPGTIDSVDPMQLLALELVSDALKDAGQGALEGVDRARTSVVFGFSGGVGEKGAQYVARSELPRLLGEVPGDVLSRLPEWTEDSFAGILPNVAAGRVANRFDLGGSNMVVDAACASSLAAVYAGVMELESGRADTVIAGGVDTLQAPFGYLCFSKTQALSPRGICNTFDKKADGIVISEGLAAVVLKRRADAEGDGDRIYGVIKGIGASSDGRAKGLTAPLPAGQKRALERAYAQARFTPDTVGLFEAHGTGTVAGDRAELETVTGSLRAAGAGPRNSAIGSVKTLIGHTKASAGIAGLIKVTLGLHHKVLPPHAQVSDPNAVFEDPEAPLYLAQSPQPWVPAPGRPRRAGVSSFGFGGTNFHVALEEHADPHAAAPPADPGVDALPFAFAADSREALLKQVARLDPAAAPGLKGLALKALEGAGDGPVRLAFTARSLDEAGAKLAEARAFLEGDAPAPPPGLHYTQAPRLASGGRLAFLFPGQGSQYPGMARQGTMLHPAMLAALETAEAALADTPTFGGGGRRLARLIWPEEAFTPEARKAQMAALTATEVAQPALGAIGAGMAGMLARLGVVPDMVAGHSYGEFVALHVAGAFDLATLIRLSEARGRAMVENGDPDRPGAMAAVAADAQTVEAAIAGLADVVLANRNSPRQTVIAGPRAAITQAMEAVTAAGLQVTAVPVSQAFHSPLMAAARGQFDAALAAVDWRATRLPVYSNTSGAVHEADPDAQRAVMSAHLVSPVEFTGMIRAMAADGARVFVEVGPKSVLSGRVPEILGSEADVRAIALDRASGDAAALAEGLAQLFVEGARVDLAGLVAGLAEPLPRSVTHAGADPRHLWHLNGAYARRADAARRDTRLPAPSTRSPGLSPGLSPTLSAAPSPLTTGPDMPPPPDGSAVPPALPRLQEELEFMEIHDHDPPPPPGGPPSILGEYHRMMQEFLRVQENVMLAYLGGSPRTAQPLAPVASPAFAAPAPVPRTIPASVAAPVAAPAVAPVVQVPTPAPTTLAPTTPTMPPAPAPAPVPAPVAAVPAGGIDLMGAFTTIVAEKTGYPEDALDPDQGMEADLGIDSIKRMEILGAVQKILPETAAEAMRAEMDRIAELSTIREIVGFIEGHMGGAPTTGSQATGPQATGTGGAGTGDTRPFDPAGEDHAVTAVLPRYIQVPFHEPADHVTETLPQGLRVLVTEAEDGFHDHLVRVLADAGAVPVILPRAVLEAGDFADWLSALDPEGAPQALVWLESRAAMPDPFSLDLADWRELHARQTKRFFALLGALSPHLRTGGRILAVTASGGVFGRSLEEGTPPMSAGAGVIGIVKALSLEWRACSSKVVDLDPAEDPAAQAAHLVHEMSFVMGRREVGYPGGARTILRTEPASLAPPGRPPLLPGPDWVIVATGGARGITAECLRSLAPFGPTLVLIGRSPAPAPEPPETAALDRAGLRAHLLAAARARGEKPRPVEIEADIARIMAARDIRTNLQDFERMGAKVDLRVADMAEADRVIAEVQAQYGRIDLLIHGAGLIEDALIEAKTPDSFDRVFDVKVDGAFRMIRALDPAHLKGICFFTSVAGRYGNRGQTDYAAANEVLNRLAWDLRRRLGPGVAVKAINWGPWGVTTTGAGMVTDSVRAQFEARGIGMVEARAGRDLFFKEMFWACPEQVESVGWVADGETMEARATALPAPPGVRRVADGLILLRGAETRDSGPEAGDRRELIWRFDLVNAPYVDHHRFDGVGVMPATAVMQLMSEVPRAFGIEAPVIELRDFQIFKGLTLDAGPFDVVLELEAREEGLFRVNLRAADNPARLRFRGDLVLGEGLPEGPERCPEDLARTTWTGLDMGSIYRRWLSHGPRFQTLTGMRGIEPSRIWAGLVPSRPQDFVPVDGDARWTFDPGMLDGVLQTVWIWSRAVQGGSALPLRVARVRRFAGDTCDGPLTAVVDVLSAPGETTIETTSRVYNAAGEACYELERFAGQSSSRLNRLGGGWQGGAREETAMDEGRA